MVQYSFFMEIAGTNPDFHSIHNEFCLSLSIVQCSFRDLQ